MESIRFSIAKEFSITPGPRYIDEGEYSGEELLRDHLDKIFKNSLKNNQKIEINLDGTLGYGTSFLEEVFGGLARSYGKEKVIEVIQFISNEEPYLIEDIKEYIENAEKS